MRLLVTGANGFVGRHVVAAAARDGFEVHATSRSRPDHPIPDAVTWHRCDLLREGDSAQLIDAIRPTHVLHAAWETAHGIYWTSPTNVTWLSATTALAQAFAAAGGERFVLAGTCAEYDWSQGVMFELSSPTRPHTLYGTCKLAAHDLLRKMSNEGRLSSATGRIFLTYGPHEDPARLVPYIARNLIADKPVLLSSARQVRDFLHIEDVAQAFLVLLKTSVAGGVNIGSGAPVRLSEIAAILAGLKGPSAQIQIGMRPDREDDVPVLVPDVTRLFDLGWRPSIDLEAGLAKTLSWWASQP